MRPLWAVLRSLPWLPAPLREGRELTPAAWVGRASPSVRLPASLREGRELKPAAWWAALRPLPNSLLHFAKDGSLRLRLGGQRFALRPAPCFTSRRTGAYACGWWAALRPLPGSLLRFA
ncbi:hypothetical protein ABGV42_10820 [Paenibacillus pabuli]|uniref:hypothetical protein n=1 Tax=Paenibacillus pabuli TaxID=1472 RepID=UPI0032423E57